MYHFSDPISRVRGLGPSSVAQLSKQGIHTVGELLTLLPLRYEDRSQLSTVDQLVMAGEKQTVTLTGTFGKLRTQYRGRSSIQRGVLSDQTGHINVVWFNSPFIVKQLREDETYMVSATYDPAYKTLSKPTVEKASFDTIHTNRLVPLYSSTVPLKVGMHRRVMKHIVDNLSETDDLPAQVSQSAAMKLKLSEALTQLHFPTTEESVVHARERLALEECLALMQHSHALKARWDEMRTKSLIDGSLVGEPMADDGQSVAQLDAQLGTQVSAAKLIPATLPFELTAAQRRCITEICRDLSRTSPMNRLLIGDVGAGKTVVAAIAAYHACANGHQVAMVAPTKILAQQHARTIAKLLPDLSISVVVGGNGGSGNGGGDAGSAGDRKKRGQNEEAGAAVGTRGTLSIGTHAVLHQLTKLNPALIIFDEQQRFGVMQRSLSSSLTEPPHVLTMTATPIPRSLTLTLFAHLQVSHLDELPAGRLTVQTWLVPSAKREASYSWVAQHIDAEQAQVFVVCPFIDPSSSVALENVASVSEKFEEIKAAFPKHRIGLLHARLSKAEQAHVIQAVYDHQIDILVTTPIVEVGVDLPEAAIMIVENAERFGLSSLHQLRGRVGRAGQQGYCLLFTSSHQVATKERLKLFSNESKGLKIAELDLQNRGAGELFGTNQTGFSELRFGSWTNLELITTARQVYDELPQGWRSVLFAESLDKPVTKTKQSDTTVLAN